MWSTNAPLIMVIKSSCCYRSLLAFSSSSAGAPVILVTRLYYSNLFLRVALESPGIVSLIRSEAVQWFIASSVIVAWEPEIWEKRPPNRNVSLNQPLLHLLLLLHTLIDWSRSSEPQPSQRSDANRIYSVGYIVSEYGSDWPAAQLRPPWP